MADACAPERNDERAPGYGCAVCGRTDVRRYRAYGMFLWPDAIFCNAHLPGGPADRGWWVPLVQDEDGRVWGYTSVPAPAQRGWAALPDAQPRPAWHAGTWEE